MKKRISISALFYNVLMAFFIAGVAGGVMAQAPEISHFTHDFLQPGIFFGLIALQFVPTQLTGMYMSGIQVEIWEKTVEDIIFKNNQFWLQSVNADQYVVAGKIVHIPQAASPSAVVKNRTVLPASVTKRSDTDITYTLDEYTTDPRLIPNADIYELSYDKRASVIMDDTNALIEVISDNMLTLWAPDGNVNSASILKTSGGNVTGWVTGMTGNRKSLIMDDIRAAKKAMDKQNIPLEGRCCLLDPDMEAQLTKDMDANTMAAYQQGYDVKTGVIGRLLGFNIYVRSTVLIYTSADALSPYGSAVATDDNPVALFWNSRYVEAAKNGVTMFQDIANPLYYGDIYSFLVRTGGRIRRAKQEGVFAMIADA